MLISILLPDLRGGGAERVQLLLAQEFLKLGFDVEFALLKARGELLAEVPEQCTVVDLDVDRYRFLLTRLSAYFRDRRPDVALAAMWPLSGIACIARQLSRVPLHLIVSEHNDFRTNRSMSSTQRMILRIVGPVVYRSAAKVVAVSRGVADSLERVARLPKSCIEVIPNPITLDGRPDGADTASDALTWWENASLRLLAVGNLKQQKGFDVLLDALARLGPESGSKLIILGEGDLRAELEKQVCALQLEDSVLMPGFRSNPRLFFERASVFVLSSRWEGFGNVIVESLACGTPVVSTDCFSGPREILANGKYGKLVPVEDPAALASAIVAVAGNPPNPDLLTERARDFRPSLAAKKYIGDWLAER